MPDITQQLPRGAIPTSRALLAAAMPHVPDPRITLPSSFLMWPVELSFWGNSNHGDCVSAEEAFAKATTGPRAFIPEVTVIAWANDHSFLNGASCYDVLQKMQTSGMPTGNVTYDDGASRSVNWTNAGILQSAIYSFGPVKLGVAAENFQTNKNGLVSPGASGWAMYDYPANMSQDHCVSLCGYGTLAQLTGLFAEHGVTVAPPAGMPTGLCYAVFTWNSIGIVDAQSLLNMTSEAWVRYPGLNKVTLAEASPKTPSLASLGNLLYLAWIGIDSNNLNVICSADHGITFGGKNTSPDTSPQAPSLCAHNGLLFLAWKGDGNDNINVAQVILSGNAVTGLTKKLVLGEQTPGSPALASFNGRLYLAWKGDSNDNLNLISSADNGASFTNKYVSPENSPQPPALTVHNGNLYIAWKGDGNDNLNVAQVVVAGETITGFTRKVVLPDQTPMKPSLASLNGRLYLGWRGDGDDNLNVETSSDNGASFGGKYISVETSDQAPSLCVHDGSVLIAWKGDNNNNFNVARVPI
jgi:hypothetical protein